MRRDKRQKADPASHKGSYPTPLSSYESRGMTRRAFDREERERIQGTDPMQYNRSRSGNRAPMMSRRFGGQR